MTSSLCRTDVQVYDGAIITSAGPRQGANRLPKRLAAGEAARFLSQPEARPVPMAFRPDRFVRRLPADVGIPLGGRRIIDPEIDGNWGWRGGGIQVRISTDREMGWPAVGNGPSYYQQRQMGPTAEQEELARNPRLVHLTMWFHAPTKTPCLTINDGMLFANITTNPAGFHGA